jgi:hypothetical protein
VAVASRQVEIEHEQRRQRLPGIQQTLGGQGAVGDDLDRAAVELPLQRAPQEPPMERVILDHDDWAQRCLDFWIIPHADKKCV